MVVSGSEVATSRGALNAGIGTIPALALLDRACAFYQVAQLDVELRHPGIEYMVLRVRDENEVDLVAHFESCFEFIDRGRAAGEQEARSFVCCAHTQPTFLLRTPLGMGPGQARARTRARAS